MPYTPGRDDRRSLRLRGHDYSAPGAYFVTICVQDRRCLLGEVAGGEVSPSAAGTMVSEAWHRLPAKFANVTLDAFTVMPNHIHGILLLHQPPVGVGPRAYPCPPRDQIPESLPPPHPAPASPPLPSVSAPGFRAASGTGTHVGVPLHGIVGWFKTMTTNAYIRGVREEGWARFEGRLWQRNYFEHILRNEERLNAARRYIENNPRRWDEDPERPR